MTPAEECRQCGHLWIYTGDKWGPETDYLAVDVPPDVFITYAGAEDYGPLSMSGFRNAEAYCHRCGAKVEPGRLSEPTMCAATFLAARLVAASLRNDEYQADTDALIQTIANELLMTAWIGVAERAEEVRAEEADERRKREERHAEWLRSKESGS